MNLTGSRASGRKMNRMWTSSQRRKYKVSVIQWVGNGRLSCGSPRLVALGIFGAWTKLKSAANDLPYTSQVALGLFGQCTAQASKVAHWNRPSWSK